MALCTVIFASTLSIAPIMGSLAVPKWRLVNQAACRDLSADGISPLEGV